MKKLFSLVISALTALSLSPVCAFAEGDPDTSDDAIFHKEHVRIIGDVNYDDKVNVADLVSMLLYLHGSEDFYDSINHADEFCFLDLNFDMTVDSFDLVELRKIILAPETAFKQISQVDILETADKAVEKAVFISSPEEAADYLANIGTDDEEIQKYLDIYNEDFFAKSDVVFGTIEQKYGNGIHFMAPECAFAAGRLLDKLELMAFSEYYDIDPDIVENSDIYFLLTCQEYNTHPMVYPKKTSILLFHTSVPKALKEMTGGSCVLLDFELFTPEYRAYTLTTDDLKHQIYVTLAENHFMDDTCHYIFWNINDDGTYTYFGEYYDEYFESDPFAKGYNVFYGDPIFHPAPAYIYGDKFRITWQGETVTVEVKDYFYDEKIDDTVYSWRNIKDTIY